MSDEPIRRLRAADPASEAEPSRQRADAIRAAAAEQAAADLGPAGVPPEPRPRSRHWTLGLAGGAVAVLVIALALVLGGGGSGPGSSPQFAQAAIRIAESSPRLLIGEPGWRVQRVDELSPNQGQILFAKHGQRIAIYWQPAALYVRPRLSELRRQALIAERNTSRPNGEPVPHVAYERTPVLGSEAILAHTTYDEGGFALSLPPSNGSFAKVFSEGPHQISRQRFLNLVDSLHQGDVETWLSKLPRDVVRPVDHEAAVDRILRDVPIPESVDADALRSEDLAMDPRELRDRVTSTVACGWLDQWAKATRTGDSQAAAAATEAMATSPDWPILKRMRDRREGVARTVWRYAVAMQAGNRKRLLGPGDEIFPDGAAFVPSPAYASHLGCDSVTYKRAKSAREARERGER